MRYCRSIPPVDWKYAVQPEAWALAVALSALPLVALPQTVYESWVGERAYAYFNWLLVGYLAVSLGAFVCGSLCGRLVGRRFVKRRGRKQRVAAVAWWSALFTAWALETARIVAVLAALGWPELEGIRSLAWRTRVAEVLGELNIGLLGWSAKALWVWCLDAEAELASKHKTLRRVLLGCSALTALLAETLAGHRGPIFVLLVAAVLIMAWRASAARTKVRLFPMLVLVVVLGGWLAWSGVLWASGVSSRDTAELAALYWATAWNRAAAVIGGEVEVQRSGSGERVLAWLYDFPGVNWRDRWAQLLQAELEDPTKAWLDEFAALEQQGLRGGFIWLTAFGYVYADLGWYGGLWFWLQGLGTGLLAAWAGRRWARCIQCWVMAGIAGWIGTVMVAKPWSLCWLAGVLVGELLATLAGRGHGRCADEQSEG